MSERCNACGSQITMFDSDWDWCARCGSRQPGGSTIAHATVTSPEAVQAAVEAMRFAMKAESLSVLTREKFDNAIAGLTGGRVDGGA